MTAIVAGTDSVAAQDLFGSAVTVAGGDVLVVKPGSSRGSAAVLVFGRADGGAWERKARLEPIAARPGEGFGASLASAGDVLLVAAADPDAVWAAHVFRRMSGSWVAAGRIPWKPEIPSGPASAPLDLAGLMRFAQPSARIVAIAPDASFAAIAGGGATFGEVLVVRARAGATAWDEEARLRSAATGGQDLFGAALAISSDRLVVGSPAANGRGAVRVFSRQSDGSWIGTGEIASPAELSTRAGFGAAVALDGERVLVGAPAAGAVLSYRRAGEDSWTLDQTLRADADAGTGFGSSIGLHANELWVGAPATDSARGAVHRFRRASPGAEWIAAAAQPASAFDARSSFGVALDVGEDVAVAGASRARGGHGLAGVWGRDASGIWSGPAVLEPDERLEIVTGSEVQCENGRASQFVCGGVDLLAFLPISAIGGEPGESVTDLWGWTDPETKREYALVGRRAGVAIVDVTNPSSPHYLGLVPGNPAGPRDVKVYRDHLFFVGDGAGEHGLVVFDLKRLRGLLETPVRFAPDARYDGMASAHNLVIDVESGTAIPVGSSGGGNTCGGGLHMVDVRDPLNPVFAGCYTDTEGLISQGRTHDAQCLVYRGPDARYRERQVCFVSNETALRIVDITDKAAPEPISRATYPSRGYIHQGWLTEDQRYFFMNDEVDELVGLTDRTRTLIWDVADLEDPVLAGEYFGPDAATDHNLYIRGNRMYLANYQAGLRVVDISDPLRPAEIGFFDTTPYGDNPPGWFGGAWTAYPFLESGTVLVSSINEGLFLLRPRERPVS
jgi:choice-of-anchor B domain-containing protein